jgi:hypothetical protein
MFEAETPGAPPAEPDEGTEQEGGKGNGESGGERQQTA